MPSSERLTQQKHLIVRGAKVPVPFGVYQFADTGFEFIGRPRTSTRAVVTHLTGAENAPGTLYDSMGRHYVFKDQKRVPAPLSIHFAVDQKGDVYQMADTEMRGAHAVGKGGDRSANAWSIGIEFIGRGSDLSRPARGYERERIKTKIHGQPVVMDELFDAQVKSGLVLLEALCRLYSLPVRVPEEANGDVLQGVLSDALYDGWRGVLAHPHVERGKTDLSPKLMRAVQRRGRELDQARA